MDWEITGTPERSSVQKRCASAGFTALTVLLVITVCVVGIDRLSSLLPETIILFSLISVIAAISAIPLRKLRFGWSIFSGMLIGVIGFLCILFYAISNI
jgi:drug/metabolite transporter (DMT)-like permease